METTFTLRLGVFSMKMNESTGVQHTGEKCCSYSICDGQILFTYPIHQ